MKLDNNDVIVLNGIKFGVVETSCTSGSADSMRGGGNDCYLTLALNEDLIKARKIRPHAIPDKVINLYFKNWPSTQQLRDTFNNVITRKFLGLPSENEF